MVAMIPQMFYLPFGVSIWCILCWLYAIQIFRKSWPRPNIVIRQILAVVGVIGLVTAFRSNLAGDFFISLLSLMASMKPFEIQTHRDKMVTIFLAYFIVVTNLFQFDALPIIGYMFLSVFVSTAVMIHVNHEGSRLKNNLRLSFQILIRALPLMAALFLLFPRIQEGFWGSSGRSSGITGFSEKLTMGDVTNLVQNDEVAFRVEFKNNLPDRDLLYWRGVVFQKFDGLTWSVRKYTPLRIKPLEGENLFEYDILYLPHKKKWMFSLGLPFEVHPRTMMLKDNTLRLIHPLKQKRYFQIQSYTSYNTGPMEPWEKKSLYLPAKGNPQARALAQKWKENTINPEGIVRAALNYFSQQDFVYALKIPPISKDRPVDAFLFDTRKGFCEHYASSFAFLMRAAGIPARIVGGYLGGRLNPYGNFLVVRQADAHVWTEVWISEKGWVRIDPTAAVEPGRIEYGMQDVLQPDDVPAFMSDKGDRGFDFLLDEASLAWDAVNARWETWFIGFSDLHQKELLEKIGLKARSWTEQVKILLIIPALGILPIFGFLIWRLFRSPHEEDPVERIYMKFCKKLGSIGLEKRPGQGPMDYSREICRVLKDQKAQVGEITDHYVLLRYADKGDATTLKELESLVKKFNPD